MPGALPLPLSFCRLLVSPSSQPAYPVAEATRATPTTHELTTA